MDNARAQGIGNGVIRGQLLQAGWGKAAVDEVLRRAEGSQLGGDTITVSPSRRTGSGKMAMGTVFDRAIRVAKRQDALDWRRVWRFTLVYFIAWGSLIYLFALTLGVILAKQPDIQAHVVTWPASALALGVAYTYLRKCEGREVGARGFVTLLLVTVGAHFAYVGVLVLPIAAVAIAAPAAGDIAAFAALPLIFVLFVPLFFLIPGIAYVLCDDEAMA